LAAALRRLKVHAVIGLDGQLHFGSRSIDLPRQLLEDGGLDGRIERRARLLEAPPLTPEPELRGKSPENVTVATDRKHRLQDRSRVRPQSTLQVRDRKSVV